MLISQIVQLIVQLLVLREQIFIRYEVLLDLCVKVGFALLAIPYFLLCLFKLSFEHCVLLGKRCLGRLIVPFKFGLLKLRFNLSDLFLKRCFIF